MWEIDSRVFQKPFCMTPLAAKRNNLESFIGDRLFEQATKDFYLWVNFKPNES